MNSEINPSIPKHRKRIRENEVLAKENKDSRLKLAYQYRVEPLIPSLLYSLMIVLSVNRGDKHRNYFPFTYGWIIYFNKRMAYHLNDMVCDVYFASFYRYPVFFFSHFIDLLLIGWGKSSHKQ